ncbi:hypothetical protein HanRHA438_Chr09g0402761 [Helianthus annuus]|nr:hypothetical protein HanRHA438_Chr09g0402761 [Helianthus annuus]
MMNRVRKLEQREKCTESLFDLSGLIALGFELRLRLRLRLRFVAALLQLDGC